MATGKVTDLQFSYYDVSRYILDDTHGVSLTSLNRSLLYLFNNDILIYSRINGQFKGLWWKSWYDGTYQTGYSLGDIVTVNGIPELSFLQQNWSSLKRMMDKVNPDEELPLFDRQNSEVVSRYSAALSEFFYLGDRLQDQQLYISLSDDNKYNPLNTGVWQPYVVTDYELSRKTYLVENLFRELIIQHEEEYHTGLDALDEADAEYEKNPTTNTSIYDSILKTHLPRRKLKGECQEWVDFTSTEGASKILALGSVSHEFLHITKPLGKEGLWLESRVRTDGYVDIKGYVPLALLNEIVPEKGTIEYNMWKNGGMRRFGLRLDFPINNDLSRFFHTVQKAEELADEDSIEPQSYQAREVVPIATRSTSDAYMSLVSQLMEKFTAMKNDLKKISKVAEFPDANDAWCQSTYMVVKDGGMLPSKLQADYLSARNVPFMVDVDKLKKTHTSSGRVVLDELIDSKYKKDSSVVTFVGPESLVSHIQTEQVDGSIMSDDGSTQHDGRVTVSLGTQDNSNVWTNWQLLADISYYDDSIGKPVRSITVMPLVTADTLGNLFYYNNSNVENLTSVTAGTHRSAEDDPNPDTSPMSLGEFMNACAEDDRKFKIGTVEWESDTITIPNQQITYDGTKKKTITVPATSTAAQPPVDDMQITTEVPCKIQQKGNIIINYRKLHSLEASIDLAEIPHDHLSVETVIDTMQDTIDDINEQNDKIANRIYYLISKSDSGGMVLFYPKNCVDKTNNNAPITFRDFALMTDEERREKLPETSYATINPETIETIEWFFTNEGLTCTSSEGGSNQDVITYMFRTQMSKASQDTWEEDEIGDDDSQPVVEPSNDSDIISSDLRLIREFGTIRSPMLKTVLSMRVDPITGEIGTPKTQNCSIEVEPWNFVNGQVAIFTVPPSTQNISFEIGGIARMDEVENRDASFYGSIDTEGTIILKWIDLLISYFRAVDVIKCLKDFNFHVTEAGVEVDHSELIQNIQPMMDRLGGIILDQKFFPILLSMRNIDITPLETLVAPILHECDLGLQLVNDAETLDTLKSVINTVNSCYQDFIRVQFKKLFIYNGLYEIYTFMADGYNLGDKEALVKRVLLRNMLRTAIPEMAVPPDLVSAISAYRESQKPNIVSALSDISERMTRLNTRYRAIVEAVTGDASQIDLEDGEVQGAINKLRNTFTTGSLDEISTYTEEVDNLLDEINKASATLDDWLSKLGIGETRDIVETRRRYLNDYHDRCVDLNKDICRGYMCYIDVHMNLLYTRKTGPHSATNPPYSELVNPSASDKTLVWAKESYSKAIQNLTAIRNRLDAEERWSND